MAAFVRRVLTGHDEAGKSIALSDGPSPQHHPMQGPEIGADFFEVWSDSNAVPVLAAVPERELLHSTNDCYAVRNQAEA